MSRIKRGRLHRSGILREDVNPMESVVNIVDAMLVFACGLMLSLVIYWNVDFQPNNMAPVTPGDEFISESELNEHMGQSPDGENGYEEIGVVYRDPVTGKLYLSEHDDVDDGSMDEGGYVDEGEEYLSDGDAV